MYRYIRGWGGPPPPQYRDDHWYHGIVNMGEWTAFVSSFVETDHKTLAEWESHMLAVDPPDPSICPTHTYNYHSDLLSAPLLDKPRKATKAYCDPVLHARPSVYADFLKHMGG